MSSFIVNNHLVSELLVFTLYKVIKGGVDFDEFHGLNCGLKALLKAHVIKSLEQHERLAIAIAPTLSLGSQEVLLTSISLACFADKANAVCETIGGMSRNDKIKIKTTSMLLQALEVKYDVIIDMYFNAYSDMPSEIEGHGEIYASKLARSINRNMFESKLLVGAL